MMDEVNGTMPLAFLVWAFSRYAFPYVQGKEKTIGAIILLWSVLVQHKQPTDENKSLSGSVRDAASGTSDATTYRVSPKLITYIRRSAFARYK